MNLFFKIVTEFGGVWIVLALGLFFLAFRGLREGIRFGVTVGMAVGLGWIIKVVIRHPRPDSTLALVEAHGYSFPSLHTITAVVLAFYVFFTFIRWCRLGVAFKTAAAMGFAVITGLVGWSRVYLGVHFWGDIAGGAVIGVGLYFLLTVLFDKTWRVKLSRRCKSIMSLKWLAYTFAVFLKKRRSAVVLFYAEMGAGKTTFIREVVKYLGARVSASSPTFSIINKYQENIYHADLYRVDDARELLNTGFYEILASENFVFVEWAEKLEVEYPLNAIKVKINVKEDGSRVFDFTC